MFGRSKKNKVFSNQSVVEEWRLRERWENYPTPKYDDVHTYCSVIFDGSENVFYYRTRNPNIRIGDLVYVPVGRGNEKKLARVVNMQNYVGHSVPYPLHLTKYIISRFEV